MATWVTHLMIADGVLKRFSELDRRGFRVGNIAPDCNVENEDWSAFTPSREVTHWMSSARKKASDCEAFCEQYILSRRDEIGSGEEYAFLLGYYSHLITDAAFQAMIRDEDRIKEVWRRIQEDAHWSNQSAGMEQTWDCVKKLIPKRDRMAGIYAMEAEYLQRNPQCGYLTDILPLTDFPDYIDYLPHGCIARKIKVMGYIPEVEPNADFIAMTREEYAAFAADTIDLVADAFKKEGLV